MAVKNKDYQFTMQVSHVIKSRKTTSTYAIQERAAPACFGSPAPPETLLVPVALAGMSNVQMILKQQ
jgi:hypothetical protein